MATQRTEICETPHGGVRMTAFFYDSDGNPCEEKDSVAMTIIEYDAKGHVLFSLHSGGTHRDVQMPEKL